MVMWTTANTAAARAGTYPLCTKAAPEPCKVITVCMPRTQAGNRTCSVCSQCSHVLQSRQVHSWRLPLENGDQARPRTATHLHALWKEREN